MKTTWTKMTDADRRFRDWRCDNYLSPGGCSKDAEFVGRQGEVIVAHKCEDHVPREAKVEG